MYKGQYEINKEEIIELVSCSKKVFFSLIKKIREIGRKIMDAVESLRDLLPRERYRIVKKLDAKFVILFFKRNAIFRCRNNC